MPTPTMPTAAMVFVLFALEEPTTLAQPPPPPLPSVPLHHNSVDGALSDGAWISVEISASTTAANVSVLLGEILI
jgi:hypothetical protein